MNKKGYAKKNSNKRTKINWAKIITISCFVYFAVTFVVQQFRINEYKVKEDYYTEKIAIAKEQTEEYKGLAQQTNNVEYIESLARSSLGLVKPYEKIFIDVNK